MHLPMKVTNLLPMKYSCQKLILNQIEPLPAYKKYEIKYGSGIRAEQRLGEKCHAASGEGSPQGDGETSGRGLPTLQQEGKS